MGMTKWERIEAQIIEWFMRVVLVAYVGSLIVGAVVWASA